MSSSAALKTPGAAETFWFVARGQVLRGPYTTAQLQEKIQKRDISFFDYAWRSGYTEWRVIASLDELDRRARLKRVPAYPTVSVPGGGVKMVAPVSSAPRAPAENKAAKDVHIHFARARRGSMGFYEWSLAVISSLAIAYGTFHFALEEVSRGFRSKMELFSIGRTVKAGEGRASLPPQVWSPLYSAPEFQATAEATDLWRGRALDLAVRHVSQPVPSGKASWKAGDYTVQAPTNLSLRDPKSSDLDPVYVQSVEFRGRLSPTNMKVIFVRERGDPSE